MMYRIDWSDQFYPKIVQCGDNDKDAVSFSVAKDELLEYCMNRRKHWARMTAQARNTTKRHVDENIPVPER